MSDEEKEILENAALNEDDKYMLSIFYDNDDLFDSMSFIVTKDYGKRRIKNNFAKKLLESNLAIKILQDKIETKEEKLSRWLKNSVKNSADQYIIHELADYKNIENNPGWNPSYYVLNADFTETRMGRVEALELIENGKAIKITQEELIQMKKSHSVEIKKIFEPYTKENFLSEVFISEEKYNLLINLLERKKNIILQGAPGVGKTFAAKRLAYSIIGEKNENQIEFVQFHQNYSYEDFIMGYKPTENNFELREGIFYNFCKKAEKNPDKKFFFIIDEINRGNLSKIFGELLMLIEKDHREEKIKLPCSKENFSVPENLFIVGMMNTADRSLAIIDYALRRRFSFFEMIPAFDSDKFKIYQKNFHSEIFDKLIEKIKILNKKISSDNSLGKGFCIGHSYFCGLESCDEKILRSIVDYEILPMLQEYYFDDPTTLQEQENILRGVFNG